MAEVFGPDTQFLAAPTRGDGLYQLGVLPKVPRKVRELRRLYAAGARGPALRDLEDEVAKTRLRLAYVVSRERGNDFHRAA